MLENANRSQLQKCGMAQQHVDFTRSGPDVGYVCEYTVKWKIMHPFEKNPNSCITALVQGQATSSIAFISLKMVFHLILASLK